MKSNNNNDDNENMNHFFVKTNKLLFTQFLYIQITFFLYFCLIPHVYKI